MHSHPEYECVTFDCDCWPFFFSSLSHSLWFIFKLPRTKFRQLHPDCKVYASQIQLPSAATAAAAAFNVLCRSLWLYRKSYAIHLMLVQFILVEALIWSFNSTRIVLLIFFILSVSLSLLVARSSLDKTCSVRWTTICSVMALVLKKRKCDTHRKQFENLSMCNLYLAFEEEIHMRRKTMNKNSCPVRQFAVVVVCVWMCVCVDAGCGGCRIILPFTPSKNR